MNAPEKIAFLADVQAQVDDLDLCIDAVGIKGVRHPITIRAGARLLPTIATLSMTWACPRPPRARTCRASSWFSGDAFPLLRDQDRTRVEGAKPAGLPNRPPWSTRVGCVILSNAICLDATWRTPRSRCTSRPPICSAVRPCCFRAATPWKRYWPVVRSRPPFRRCASATTIASTARSRAIRR